MSRFAHKKTSTFETDAQETYEHGYAFPTDSYAYITKPGLSEGVVREISHIKEEPAWMLEKRLEALKIFDSKPMPPWGADLSAINFDLIHYYLRPADRAGKSLADVPPEVRATYERLGIAQAEQEVLAGIKFQYDSEVLYGSLKQQFAKDGVIFLSMDEGLRQYPELVREYFGKVIPSADNKFAALNTATWSGGSFVYIPPGVQVKMPLQTYFRINAENAGQFERTLIIVGEGASAHYIEGCFVSGTPILTERGTVPIECIQADDRVLTHAGRLRKVGHTQIRPYTGSLHTIHIVGQPNQPVTATSEHPFLAVPRERQNERNKKWNARWIPVSQLKKGDYLTIPIDASLDEKPTRSFFIPVGHGRNGWTEEELKVPCTPDLFRLIGYYLAEGSISSGYYLNFSFSELERDYIEDVKNLVHSVFGVTTFAESHHYKNHGTNVVVNSVRLCRFFEQFGTHSASKTVPPWVLHESIEKQQQLILGWFRGDGNYYRKNHLGGFKEVFRICTTSPSLANQGRMLLARLGIASSLNSRDRKQEHRQTMYSLIIGGEYLAEFGRIVDQPIQEKMWGKKRATYYFIDKNYLYVPIKNIENESVQNISVYNFSVEEDESYVAGGVAVHNCTAPSFSTGSLHSAVVEIIVKKGARCQYTTIQNWYKNVYNLVTKRAKVEAEGEMVWTDFNMGCLTKQAKLYVHGRGVLPIDQVRAGDRVWSMDLNAITPVLRKVTATKTTGIKPVYRLMTENSRTIEATDNHPFLVISSASQSGGPSQMQWKKLADIQVGEKVGIIKGLPDIGVPMKIDFAFAAKAKTNKKIHAVTLPTETNEELLWMLGLYIGDGYCEKGKNQTWSRTYFAVPQNNKGNARERLAAILTDMFNIEPKEKGICLTASSTIFTHFIQNLGFGGTARTKKIPDWIFSLPRAQQLAFIQGYLDSDGYVRASKVKNGIQYGQLVFASVNKALLEDLKLLMIAAGLNPLSISTYSKFRRLYKGQWKYYTSHFLSLNLRDNWQKITHEITSQDTALQFVKVTKIEKLSKESVYDLEIEGTSNFIANGLVVHNSKITMKYPSFLLMGPGAKGETLSMALAGAGQHQDTGSKAYHLAPHTSSTIMSKSISKSGGRTSYRGMVQVAPQAHGSKNTVICDALLLDGQSRSDTYPTDRIMTNDVEIQHEATVSKIGDDQLFYLMSRGVTEEDARKLIVNGFVDDLVRKLPLEYAVEMNRLIDHEMEGSIG